MSKKTKQIGSVTAILIIVIGLLVVGVGGYFVWTRYFNEPEPISVQPDDIVPESENPEEEDSEDTATTPITPETTTPATTTVDDGMYHITQWGLKGDYNGSYSVQYEVSKYPDGTPFVRFSSSSLPSQYGGYCELANLQKASSLNNQLNPVAQSSYNGINGDFYTDDGNLITKHIGNYYYAYGSSKAGCFTENTEAINHPIQVNILSGLNHLFASLVEE